MNEKEFRERRKRQGREVRKAVISDFFHDFTKYFRPWLHELTKRYKERGEFPVLSCWLLPSYYQNEDDKEVAAFAALLIKDDEKVVERVEDFRLLMGESPYQWFKDRAFVALSIGTKQFQRTGGVLNQRIAEYFNTVYENWGRRVYVVEKIMRSAFGENTCITKANLLRLVLGTSDGIGLGVRTITPPTLKCPLTEPVVALLKTFFPDYKRLDDADAAVHLFGFEKDYDFFYAALAYKELQKRNPKGCSRLATVYQKRYREGNLLEPKYWYANKRDGILIDLNS